MGFLEDPFLFATIPTFICGAILLRRLLRKVDEVLALFPGMLKPEVANTPGEANQLVQSLAEVRETIALRSPRARRLWLWLWAFWMLVGVLLFQWYFPCAESLNLAGLTNLLVHASLLRVWHHLGCLLEFFDC